MKKTQIIKDSLYDYLNKKGYSYISDRNIWVFRKEDGEIRKEIAIHDIYGNSVRFDFATTVGGKEGMPYMDSRKVRLNDEGFCEYQNEEEFRIIIDEIKRVIITKGEEIFSDISVISEEQRLTWEMEKKLFDNHEQLIEKGKIILGISKESSEEKINIIIEQLKSIKGKELQEISEELLMLSAVYGQIYEEEFEGKWVYYNGYCGINCVSDIMLFPMLSLELDIDEIYKLMINKYKYILDKHNRFLKRKNNLS